MVSAIWVRSTTKTLLVMLTCSSNDIDNDFSVSLFLLIVISLLCALRGKRLLKLRA